MHALSLTQSTTSVMHTSKGKLNKYFFLLVIFSVSAQLCFSQVSNYQDFKDENYKIDEGVFTVFHKGEHYYFEIPLENLDKPFLVVNRISGYVDDVFNYGSAGMRAKEGEMIQWQMKNDKVILRYMSSSPTADQGDPIIESVQQNNYQPIIKIFTIVTSNPKTGNPVIDVSSLVLENIYLLSPLTEKQRKSFSLTSVDTKRSFVEGIKSFPENVEVKYVLTYGGKNVPDNKSTQTLSMELNLSFVKLPEKPMPFRYADTRVGNFYDYQRIYSSEDTQIEIRRMVERWDLKPGNKKDYLEGKLVEPIKPITIYIDRATPKKWKKYIIQGINDWLPVFEAIGFKNAIKVLDQPADDKEWSPEDSRHTMFRWVATDIQDAQGNVMTDPRSGQILKGNLIWYHNYFEYINSYYFALAAAVDEKARTPILSDEVFGKIMRGTMTHEMGHMLGFHHNMVSSASYPVDSLRSASFTQKMGLSASIMDYADYNYVAQPGDHGVEMIRKIGPYDYWLVQYAYQPIYDTESPQEEKKILNEWILDKYKAPIYRFIRQEFPIKDPSNVTGDLGDDPVVAGMYAISNLKRIVPNLIEWSCVPGIGYDILENRYDAIFKHTSNVFKRAAYFVGGVYKTPKTYDMPGPVVEVVSRKKQTEAVDFICDQLLKTPIWLINEEAIEKLDDFNITEKISSLQNKALDILLDNDRVMKLNNMKRIEQSNEYTFTNLLNQLTTSIFKETETNTPVSFYRRNLQRQYIKKLYDLSKEAAFSGTDVPVIIAGEQEILKVKIEKSLSTLKDTMSKAHFEDLLSQL